MSPTLGALLEGVEAEFYGPADAEITGIAYDSRRVTPGDLFVALRGVETDGHLFTAEALRAGARALLVEELPAQPAPGVPVARVASTRDALAPVSARLFDRPGDALALIGVTGTNGKTSTVRLLESILGAAGRACGSIGTISMRYPGVERRTGLTTPESADLQRMLAEMRDAGVEAVALEVSSHSLELARVRTLRFAAAVFTNLTQDHLDFHSDLESYARAKARLFGVEYLDGTAVVHAADGAAARFVDAAQAAGRPVVRFAREERAGLDVDFRTSDERITLEGSRFEVIAADGSHPLVLPLPGDFQLENALAATATARVLGVDWAAIDRGLKTCPPVPGRLERVSPERPAVFVDYAHTPDALDAVLGRVRSLVSGRLIAVFGCGGDRDRSKRAPMARAACRHADLAIATSDNPRTEDPAAILRDVEAGLSGSFELVPDRRRAIRRAVEEAGDADVVVIAGKGHEDYQIVGRERRPFDDRNEAIAALRERRP